MQEALTEALRKCADAIKAKVSANAEGEPEAQLSWRLAAGINRNSPSPTTPEATQTFVGRPYHLGFESVRV